MFLGMSVKEFPEETVIGVSGQRVRPGNLAQPDTPGVCLPWRNVHVKSVQAAGCKPRDSSASQHNSLVLDSELPELQKKRPLLSYLVCSSRQAQRPKEKWMTVINESTYFPIIYDAICQYCTQNIN